MDRKSALLLTIGIGVFLTVVIAAMPVKVVGSYTLSKVERNSTSIVSSSPNFRQGEKSLESKAQGESLLTKTEITGGRLFLTAPDTARKTASLVSTSLTKPGDIEQLLLPVAMDGGGRFFKWKIHNGSIYSVSVVESSPGQQTFTLISANLQDLRVDPYKIAHLGSGGLHRFKDMVVTVGPLTTAAIVAQSLEGHDVPRYDFIVSDKGQYDFFIQQDGQLHRWRYEKDANWQKIASVAFNGSEDFMVIKDNGNLVLVTVSGQHYLIEEAGLTQISENEATPTKQDEKAAYLMVDTDNHEHYFFSADKGARSVGMGNSILYSNRTLRQAVLPSRVAEAMNVVLKASSDKRN
jgi:hypothetical protein